MNLLQQILSAFANAVQALWRVCAGLREERPDPYHISRYAGWSGPYAHVSPTPLASRPAEPLTKEQEAEATSMAWNFRAPVSLRKSASAVKLVRPFVGQLTGPARPATVDLAKKVVAARRSVATTARAVGRVVALDVLGLPLRPMASSETPTVGVFEQTLTAWKLRTGNRDVSWA
jgi:hypothetical protein